MNSSLRSNDKGFTLTELLVSIGVVALLTGIALPALSASRKSSKDTKCITHLRQIATNMSERMHEPRRTQGSLMFVDEELVPILYCPRCPNLNENGLGGYILYSPRTFNGVAPRPLVVADQYNISKIPIARDYSKWHGWLNAGYLDGSAHKVDSQYEDSPLGSQEDLQPRNP